MQQNYYPVNDLSSEFDLIMNLLTSAGVRASDLDFSQPNLDVERLTESVALVAKQMKDRTRAQINWSSEIEKQAKELVALLRVNESYVGPDQEVIASLLEVRAEALRNDLDHLLENGF